MVALASVALRNMILGVGALAMMVVTSPSLRWSLLPSRSVVISIAFRTLGMRAVPMTQDMLAKANAYASEQIGAMRYAQAFTSENMVVRSVLAAR